VAFNEKLENNRASRVDFACSAWQGGGAEGQDHEFCQAEQALGQETTSVHPRAGTA